MEIKLQRSPLDCGLVCLQAFYFRYYKKWLPIEVLRHEVPPNSAGISIANLVLLGRKYHLSLEAYRTSLGELRSSGTPTPLIALIKNENQNHYVIFLKFRKDRVIYIDPVLGRRILPIELFQATFQGVIIHVYENLINVDKNWDNVQVGIHTLGQFKNYLLLVFLTSLITTIFTLIATLYAKILLDNIIPSFKNKELLVITIIFSLLATLRAFNGVCLNFIKTRLTLKISGILFGRVLRKIFAISCLEFDKFDVSERFKKIQTIRTLTDYWVAIGEVWFSSCLLGLVSVITMFVINSTLSFVVMVFIIVLFGFTLWNHYINRERAQKAITLELNYNRNFYDLISSSTALKDLAVQNQFTKTTTESINALFRNHLEISNTNNNFSFVRNLIIFVFPFVIYYVSTQKIFGGQLQIGAMIVYATMFGFLTSTITNLSAMLIMYSEYKNELTIFNDFLNIQDEKVNKNGYMPNRITKLELRNFRFSYGGNGDVLHVPYFQICENIYVDGANGTGKTTFLKCMAGLFTLQNVFINKIELTLLNLQYYRSQVVLVSSEFFIPSTTILSWLTNDDTGITHQLLTNLETYGLLEMLRHQGLSLEQKIFDNGSDFSRGQKQIIGLLKLLARRYQLILLDESFSSVDKTIRAQLIAAIFDFQREALVIATTHQQRDLPIKRVVNINEINRPT